MVKKEVSCCRCGDTGSCMNCKCARLGIRCQKCRPEKHARKMSESAWHAVQQMPASSLLQYLSPHFFLHPVNPLHYFLYLNLPLMYCLGMRPHYYLSHLHHLHPLMPMGRFHHYLLFPLCLLPVSCGVIVRQLKLYQD